MLDVPTNTSANVANYPTLNPLNNPRGYVTYSDGNLNAINSTNASHSQFEATQYIETTFGKVYWEVTANGDSNTRTAAGIGENIVSTSTVAGNGVRQFGWYVGGAAAIYWNNEGVNPFNVAWASGDVLNFAYEPSTGKLYAGRNGTFFDSTGATNGSPATNTNPTVTISSPLTMKVIGSVFNQGTNSNLIYNFGQRPFTYTPPSGYVALNTYNLPTPTILQGNLYMDASLYTGDGSSSLTAVNQAQFKPDFVWIKIRSGSGQHVLTDSVRGVSKQVFSSLTNAETTEAGKGITSFNSNGFTLGNELVTTGTTNVNAATYVGWQWQAGQGTTTVNTSGATSSNVSVSTTAGFSVVTYTGTGANTTIGHGLSAAPKMVIVKNRGSAVAWAAWHTSIANTQYLVLNTTAAAATGATWWNSTTPTSSVISVGTSTSTNASGNTYVAYCWAEIAGFSKFGSYTGNGSADGSFVYLGFRPRYLMIGPSSNTTNFQIIDTSRDPYNLAGLGLDAGNSSAEYTPQSSGYPVDILSNGFKQRSTSQPNTSGQTYIYMAFAENPFKNSNAR